MLSRFSDNLRERAIGWLSGGSFSMSNSDIILNSAALKEQKAIQRARQFYTGDHEIPMTPAQNHWLKSNDGLGDINFRFNMCRLVVDSISERLTVLAINTAPKVKPDKAVKVPDENLNPIQDVIGAICWQWWTDNRYDSAQKDVYRATAKDTHSFILVDWDEEKDIPKFLRHERYVSRRAGGSGSGMWAEWANTDTSRPPVKVVKQWFTYDEEGKEVERRTEYTPGVISRYIRTPKGWIPYTPSEAKSDEIEGDGSRSLLVDKSGKALSFIPVVVFVNPGGVSDLDDAIPLQVAADKVLLDILASADMTGFRSLITLGWYPTTDGEKPKADGSNALRLTPAGTMGTDVSPQEADVKVIEPADNTGLLATFDKVVTALSVVTATPLSRFHTSGQMQAEGTLKEQATDLVARAEERQVIFGNSFEDMMKIALYMQAAYGTGAAIAANPNDIQISVEWKTAQIRNDKEVIELALLKAKALGIPPEITLKEVGYSADEVAAIMASETFKAREAAVQAALEGARALDNSSNAD